MAEQNGVNPTTYIHRSTTFRHSRAQYQAGIPIATNYCSTSSTTRAVAIFNSHRTWTSAQPTSTTNSTNLTANSSKVFFIVKTDKESVLKATAKNTTNSNHNHSWATANYSRTTVNNSRTTAASSQLHRPPNK